jgi:hypothetical protein
MIAEKKQIKVLRMRLVALVVWNACFWTATGWGFLCGALILLWRILGLPLDGLWIFGLGGLVLVCGLAAFFSARRWPSLSAVAALMDARLAGGGLVMAMETGQTNGWTAPDTRLIPRWQGRIPGLVFLAAFSFLLLAVHVPLAGSQPLEELPLEIGAMVEQMEERVELLEEIGLIEEERAEEWVTLMHALQQESRGTDPAATWEALDQLAERFEDDVAVEVMSRRMEVQKREELVAALKAALQAYDEDREAADAAMQELSDLLRQAAEKNPNLQALLDSLPEFGMQQVAGGILSREEAQLLADRLSKMTAEDLQRMQQMLQQGLCQSSDCQRPGDSTSLKKFLEENPGCTNLMMCAGITPGSGGVNRGPGTAPISWLGESSEEGVGFEEQILPSSKLDSLANSQLMGESSGAPETDMDAAGSTGGVLTGTEANDSAATVHVVLPRHRKTVDRFFMRDE